MYAVVEIKGHQYRVTPNSKVYVDKLSEKEGESITIDSILLLHTEKDIKVGKPAVDGASVKAKVLRHVKSDKVIVFKKKRRKGYRVKNGHRQPMTQLLIENITE